MVLRHRETKMASEQPLKKKQRRGTSPESGDEPDFIQTTLLPAHVNEDDVIAFDTRKTVFRTSNISDSEPAPAEITNISIQPAPDIPDAVAAFQDGLVRQCLCRVAESALRQPFAGPPATLSEWPTPLLLQFLSNLQLLFDVYLKQNNSGHICAKIVLVCASFVRNEQNVIEQILNIVETRNKYANFMAAKVFSSFLIIAKHEVNAEWLETVVNYLVVENVDYTKMNFALEVIRRVVEWKSAELHALEDARGADLAGGSQGEAAEADCTTVAHCDAESFDTTGVKGLVIKSLEGKWKELVAKVQFLLTQSSVEAQTCVMAFLALWESTISVRANLSVVDTKPFYAHLEYFVGVLNGGLSAVIWKQLLSLFNEVLCYGSTLALQDMLPVDTCQLAHLIVRYVKDFRLLDSLPYRRNEGCTVNSFVGTVASTRPTESNVDRTLLQKMILLVLKSVAITVKETRSDSSDSSVGSEDYDFSQDMQLIARSIRDVLKKMDVFIKACLDFHPETPFSRTLIHLFSDQDDYMIESMVCTLDITTGISYQNALSSDFLAILDPVHSFIEFLKIVAHHSDVLLDYLIDNETCFLLYLLRFLKYVRRNWGKFKSSCYEGGAARTNELDNTMTVLIRLKMQIERLVAQDLFPYNISPILRLLEACENLYESNEDYSS